MSAFCWLQTSGVAFDNNIYAIFISPLAEIGMSLSNSHPFKSSLYLNGISSPEDFLHDKSNIRGHRDLLRYKGYLDKRVAPFL